MDKEQFVERMLTDEKIFAGYAKRFMDSKSTKSQGFLDWAWERYGEETGPGSALPGFDDDFSFDGLTLGGMPAIPARTKRSEYANE